MEGQKTDNMTRINPRTGRNITIGGKVWKSLTEEEKQKSNKLFQKINRSEPLVEHPLPPLVEHSLPLVEHSLPLVEHHLPPLFEDPLPPLDEHSLPPLVEHPLPPLDEDPLPPLDEDSLPLDEDPLPPFSLEQNLKVNQYIQNILTKTREAEDRVKIIIYRRFETEDW